MESKFYVLGVAKKLVKYVFHLSKGNFLLKKEPLSSQDAQAAKG
jgi:hypothetical protein